MKYEFQFRVILGTIQGFLDYLNKLLEKVSEDIDRLEIRLEELNELHRTAKAFRDKVKGVLHD